MSIRLDPRRLSTLRALAGEAGLRPGELVQRWVEERLDASRATAGGDLAAPSVDGGALAALAARVDAVVARLDAMTGVAGVAEPATEPAAQPATETDTKPRRRGRPPKAAIEPAAADAATEPAAPAVKRTRKAVAKKATTKRARKGKARVALHDEIAAVIAERGPQTAAELATAIGERGRYAPPRSGKPLDAATVNGRVSNPTYRARFARDGHKIGLAGS